MRRVVTGSPFYIVDPVEASKICEGLGLRCAISFVGYGNQGEIVIIRDGNIKMIPIKSEASIA